MRINRLFEIVYILLNKEITTAKELSDHFEVSTRSIYRDVELLSSSGIPIYMSKGKGGGISLLKDFVLNKTVLTGEEKDSILSAMHALDAVSFNKTDTAINKLSSLFGNSDSDWIEIDFSAWSNGEEEAKIFTSLRNAIIHKQVVEILYYSSKSNVKRAIEPLKLCFKGQSWYLYAYCKLRNDFRFFKLRRIRELKYLEQSFNRPIPPQIFERPTNFSDSYIPMTLKIAKEMAFRVYDECLDYEINKDGSFLVKIDFPKGDWIYSYLGTYGEYCQVIEPKYIRNEMKNRIQKTLKQYL